ncbi:hypothetical protein HPP92_007433 [Vanilla planifolia]|uniref:Uncharacterized protein n=1 Tax=Vanilla planifolia TaxID=51239 RepID=A0A835RMC8_VANPL|nr:hypothetical protein HPP92_007433 [Vanilla planifolia]
MKQRTSPLSFLYLSGMRKFPSLTDTSGVITGTRVHVQGGIGGSIRLGIRYVLT